MKPGPRRMLLGALALGAAAIAALASVSSAPEVDEAPPARRPRAADRPPRAPAALELGRPFEAQPLPQVDDAFPPPRRT